MTWKVFWEILGLFVIVVYAQDKANEGWYLKAMGSFTFWIVAMAASIVGMVLVAR